MELMKSESPKIYQRLMKLEAAHAGLSAEPKAFMDKVQFSINLVYIMVAVRIENLP